MDDVVSGVCLCMRHLYSCRILYLYVCVFCCVCVFQCVCSQPLMTHSVLSCRQAESEEEAVFVISPGCHSHGAFGCCHHQCNYNTVCLTVTLFTACVSLTSTNRETLSDLQCFPHPVRWLVGRVILIDSCCDMKFSTPF